MKVTLLRYPSDEDWMRAKRLAFVTVGKEAVKPPTEEWKKKILIAEHSPIRTLMFTIAMEIPYWVSVHYVRHKYGVEHYVKSQRTDRTGEDRTSKRQDETVTHIMDVNAQELIFMARRRLCGMASPETRELGFKMVEDELQKVPNEKIRGIAAENIEAIKNSNRRDFRF